ncbi:MAG TPA: fibronectin type III domain-containing protein, partial [Planctomycetota bacterium]|nr:fibronectin type III domain-containing protein [Planctomycetota bacterium]
NVSQLPVRERVSACRAIIDQAATSPALKTSKALQQYHQDFASAQVDLEAAIAALDAARKVVAAAEQEVAVKDAALTMAGNKFCSAVNATPGIDDPTIASLGLKLLPRRGALKAMSPPLEVRTKIGKNPGEAIVRWKPVARAQTYSVETTDDPSALTGWVHVASSTRATVVLSGLTAGKRTWVRVAAVGAAGTSGFTPPVAVTSFS